MTLYKNHISPALFLFIMVCMALFYSCEEEVPEKSNQQNNNQENSNNEEEILTKSDSFKRFTYEVMNHWYYWNEQQKWDTISLYNYNNGESLLNAMRKTPEDETFSYIEKESKVQRFLNAGIQNGLGFQLGRNNNDLWIIFVYKSSPLYKKGVRRGWQLLKINETSDQQIINNDVAISNYLNSGTNTFTFINDKGEEVIISAAAEEYMSNAVLFDSIYTIDQQKAGYLVFNQFTQSANSEIDSVMQHFMEKNIDELVLDLRYNSGGQITVAQKLASHLIGNNFSTEIFTRYKYNNERAPQNDTTLKFNTTGAPLDLNRLFVLTSHSTASASELIINSLKPYMPVHHIGERTFGKPYGTFSFEYKNYVLNPVVIHLVNVNGNGGYDKGIKPDIYVPDNFKLKWGDTNDPRLHQALHYIENGNYEAGIARQLDQTEGTFIEHMKGFDQHIGAY